LTSSLGADRPAAFGWDHEPARLVEDLRRFDSAKLRVGVLVWPEFTLLALAGFIDALRLAGDTGDRSRQLLCRWRIMASSAEPVASSCGVRVTPSGPLVDASEFDYIAVVAGRTQHIDDAPASHFDYLKKASGATLIGLGTGSFVLAKLGLLDGYRACVANYHYREFSERFPQVPVVFDQLFSIDRNRITCAGGAASIDLAAHLINKHCGSDRGLKIRYTMIVDDLRRPTAAQQVPRTVRDPLTHPLVMKAVRLMEQHVSCPLPIREISRLLHTTERQLERAFSKTLGVTPRRHFLRLRLQHCRWLLINSPASISQIAFDYGFADASHFTRAFRFEFDATPGEVRQRALVPSGPDDTAKALQAKTRS
jgi:transcriptional regulator GlxA family with amidase domain